MKYGIEVPVEDIEVSVLLVWVCCVVTTVLNDIGGIVEDIVEIVGGVEVNKGGRFEVTILVVGISRGVDVEVFIVDVDDRDVLIIELCFVVIPVINVTGGVV